jgi:CarD family transcriptional regulator
VVVPGLGVGTLVSIDEIPVDGESLKAYRVELTDGQGRIWVPLERTGTVGIRPVMSSDLAEQTFEVISAQTAPKKRAHWNQRRRRYEELLSSDKPREVAALIGELAAVQRVKESPLSFSEKRLMERATEMLVGEVAAALGVARSLVEQRLNLAMAI